MALKPVQEAPGARRRRLSPPRDGQPARLPGASGNVAATVVFALIALVWAFPLFKMFERSMMGKGFGNYARILFQADSFTVAKGFAFDLPDFWVNLGNSVAVSAMDMALILSLVTLAAFAFSKMEFPGREALYVLTLVGMMMPAAGFIVPYFITLKKMGLINTIFSLVGPHVAGAVPMSMMILRNSMDEINDEMIEAAVIDGCSRFGVFRRMVLPLVKPAIGTSAIFAFMGSWNDYLLPLVLLNKAEAMTLTLLPQRFTAFGGGSNYGVIFASLVLISVPIFLIYLFCQRFLVSGISSGTIK